MTTNRMKKPVKPVTLIETQADFERVVGELVERKIAQRDLQNAMDAELTLVRAKYEADLPAIETEISDRLKLAQDYCDAHPDLFPRDRKSIEVMHAVVGYRTGTPKLKLLRGWTWDDVREKLEENRVLRWLRQKIEVNKEAILNDESGSAEVLAVYGIKRVQDETFYVEPKLEEQTARVTEAAA